MESQGTKIYIHHGYTRMTTQKIVDMLNKHTKKSFLSYMDWNDLAERAWKKGARQRKDGEWYIRYSKPKVGKG